MFPIQHFIVAFVPALAYVVVCDRRLPTLRFVGVVFLGSQFPDLVDKPLAHQFVVLPSGRVFMHSLPTAVLLLLILGLYGWKTDRTRLSSAFVFAHLSHLLADNHGVLLGPNPQISPDLLWPFVPPVARPVTPSWAGPEGIYVHLWTTFSIIVLSFSVYVLLSDEKERISMYWDYLARRTYHLYLSYHSPR